MSLIGADPTATTADNESVSQWALKNDHQNIVTLLEIQMLQKALPVDEVDVSLKLNDYITSVSEDSIDFDLITELVVYIHEKIDKLGAILIFLPGYEDIINCNEMLSMSRLNKQKVTIFMLHGNMNIEDQRGVFKPTPNKQKIILSTNVTETSITIDEVCFVIDPGRAKEKTYDAVSSRLFSYIHLF